MLLNCLLLLFIYLSFGAGIADAIFLCNENIPLRYRIISLTTVDLVIFANFVRRTNSGD